MSTYLADTAEDLTVEGPSARFICRRMGPRGGVPLVLLHRSLRDRGFQPSKLPAQPRVLVRWAARGQG
jgi:hypothetical protein